MKHPLQQPTGIRHRIVVLISEMLARFDILCMCIIAFVLQLMMLELNAQQPAFIANGLVAYYPFNGNADDASGNGNNGTLLRGIFISDRFGNSNSAYYFNGVAGTKIQSSYVGILGSESRSISVWVKCCTHNFVFSVCMICLSALHTQMLVKTSWVLPESFWSIALASAVDFGFPKTSLFSTTKVSAVINN